MRVEYFIQDTMAWEISALYFASGIICEWKAHASTVGLLTGIGIGTQGTLVRTRLEGTRCRYEPLVYL